MSSTKTDVKDNPLNSALLTSMQQLAIDPIPLNVSLAATGGLYYTVGSLFADTQKSQAEKTAEWNIMLWVAFKIYCQDILAPSDYKPAKPEDPHAFASSFKAIQSNPEQSKKVFGYVLADDNFLKNMNQYLLALALYSQKIRSGMFLLALEKLATQIEDLFFNHYGLVKSIARDDKNFLMDIGPDQQVRRIVDYQDEAVRQASDVEIKEKIRELNGVVSEDALSQIVKNHLNLLERHPSEIPSLTTEEVRDILKASNTDPAVAAFLDSRLKRMLITFIKSVPEDKNSENYKIVSELLSSDKANQSRAKAFLDQCSEAVFTCIFEQQRAEQYVLDFQEKIGSMAETLPTLAVDSFNQLNKELNEKAQDIKKRVDEHKLEQRGNEPHYHEALSLDNPTDYLSEQELFVQQISSVNFNEPDVMEKHTYRPD